MGVPMSGSATGRPVLVSALRIDYRKAGADAPGQLRSLFPAVEDPACHSGRLYFRFREDERGILGGDGRLGEQPRGEKAPARVRDDHVVRLREPLQIAEPGQALLVRVVVERSQRLCQIAGLEADKEHDHDGAEGELGDRLRPRNPDRRCQQQW